jgi:2-oxoisovalerate dehydrogenase E1 component alpha subunit
MSLELLTVLDKDGKAQKGKDPNLPAAELQKLYRLMVATRALDERGLALQRQGRIGFYLQSTGQ